MGSRAARPISPRALQAKAIGTPIVRSTLLLLSTVLPPLFMSAPAIAGPQAAHRWFNERGYVEPAGGRIIACHGYGCTRRLALSVDGSLLSRVSGTLKSAQGSPTAERQALAEVIRSYTAYLAASLGGPPDVPGSPPQMSGV